MRFADISRWWRRLPWDACKVFFDQSACLPGLEISGDCENSVVRSVINPKEFTDVFDRRRIQILHRANSRVCVCRILKTHLKEAQKSVDVRLVVIAQTLLFLYSFTLIVQIL